MSPRLGSVVRWTRQGLLTVGAVLGVVSLVVAAASVLFGLRPLVFQSGSMSPAIATGALAISQEVGAADLEVGDIVSVPTGSGERVTHRIVTVTLRDDVASLALKGDANEAVDARTYEVGHADRVLFDVPLLGYAVGWVAGPMGLFALGLYAAFLLSVIFGRSPGGALPSAPVRGAGGRRKPTPGRRKATRTRRKMVATGLAVVVGCGVASGLVLEHRITPTLAAWTDPVGITGTTLTAYTVPAPAGTSCAVATGGSSSSRGVVFSWPANAAPLPILGYTTPTVTSLNAGNAVITNGTGASAGRKLLTVSYNPNPPANQNKIVTVTIRAYPTSTPTWLSPTTTWKFKTGGSQNTPPTCGEVEAPVVTFNAPSDGAVLTESQIASQVRAACGALTVVCGARSDDSDVTTQYRLERKIGSNVTCWDNFWAYGANNCTTWHDTQGSGQSWTGFGLTAGLAYGSAGVYTLHLRVSDEWGNVTTDSISFTVT